MEPDTDTQILNEGHTHLIQNQVSINVAARDGGNVPAVTRAYGCAVSSDRRKVTVFVGETAAAAVLRCVQENGSIAVVCSHPSTLRTLQLKGTDAQVLPLKPADATHIERWRRTFTEELEAHGFTPPFTRTLADLAKQPLVAIRFTLAAIFDQSPGPTAGQRVGS